MLHIDGKVVGDVSGQASDECALTLGESGVIEGNVDVRILYSTAPSKAMFGPPTVPVESGGAHRGQALLRQTRGAGEGAEINGELVHIDESQTPQLPDQGEGKEQTGDEEGPARKAAPNKTTGDKPLIRASA